MMGVGSARVRAAELDAHLRREDCCRGRKRWRRSLGEARRASSITSIRNRILVRQRGGQHFPTTSSRNVYYFVKRYVQELGIRRVGNCHHRPLVLVGDSETRYHLSIRNAVRNGV